MKSIREICEEMGTGVIFTDFVELYIEALADENVPVGEAFKAAEIVEKALKVKK